MRLLYLKYILEQSEESLISQFFKLQLDEPTRGDWASKCLLDLKELRITESLDEIKSMTKTKFASILKSRVKENALSYLKGKQKSKGKEIVYSDMDMAEYLQPITCTLTIEEKQNLFAVRNRMIEIPDNFPNTEIKPTCWCGETEDMSHIFNCKLLNEGVIQKEQYENIFNGNIKQQIRIFRKFENNMGKRETIKNRKNETELPSDPCDPLFSAAL